MEKSPREIKGLPELGIAFRIKLLSLLLPITISRIVRRKPPKFAIDINNSEDNLCFSVLPNGIKRLFPGEKASFSFFPSQPEDSRGEEYHFKGEKGVEGKRTIFILNYSREGKLIGFKYNRTIEFGDRLSMSVSITKNNGTITYGREIISGKNKDGKEGKIKIIDEIKKDGKPRRSLNHKGLSFFPNKIRKAFIHSNPSLPLKILWKILNH